MTEQLCPIHMVRFNDRCHHCVGEHAIALEQRKIDDMKHAQEQKNQTSDNLINSYEHKRRMEIEKLYKNSRAYAAGRAAGRPLGKPTKHTKVVGVVPEPLEEKPKLKVFEIRVFQDGVISDVLVMLSVDEETVTDELDEQKGYGLSFYTLKIREIVGPFKSGSILSNWDD